MAGLRNRAAVGGDGKGHKTFQTASIVSVKDAGRA
jgi:hypothetical protein